MNYRKWKNVGWNVHSSKGLIEAARACDGLGAEEIVSRIMDAADAYAAGAPQHDDYDAGGLARKPPFRSWLRPVRGEPPTAQTGTAAHTLERNLDYLVGASQVKLAASLSSPLPLYFAICG